MARNYWLYKTEPDVYSLDDLKAEGSCHWEGVRNFQARNHMKAAKKGDWVFFYHSRVKPPSIVGIAEVVKEAYPDHTQFDSKHKYFDPKSNPEKPRWHMVDVAYKKTLKRPVSLTEIKADPELAEMVLVRRSRLSIQPVTKAEWDRVLELSKT